MTAVVWAPWGGPAVVERETSFWHQIEEDMDELKDDILIMKQNYNKLENKKNNVGGWTETEIRQTNVMINQ